MLHAESTVSLLRWFRLWFRELRSHSAVLFIWSIYTAILTGCITDLARQSASLWQISKFNL